MTLSTEDRLAERARHLTKLNLRRCDDVEWVTLAVRAGKINAARLRLRAFVGCEVAREALTPCLTPCLWLGPALAAALGGNGAGELVKLCEPLGEKVLEVPCEDMNGWPCGMDFKSVDPGCSDCNGTGCVEVRVPWSHWLPTVVACAMARECAEDLADKGGGMVQLAVWRRSVATLDAAEAWAKEPAEEKLHAWLDLFSMQSPVWVPFPWWEPIYGDFSPEAVAQTAAELIGPDRAREIACATTMREVTL